MALIIQKFQTVRRLGLRYCIACKGVSFLIHQLEKILSVNSWHSSNIYSCRPYKPHVVGLVSKLNPQVIVEVGCGLGDILSNIRAHSKYGIDPDGSVIRLGKILHPFSGVKWMKGDLTDLVKVPGRIDTLILIGMLHYISPEFLEKTLTPHLSRIHYLVLDQFNEVYAPKWGINCPPFEHDFTFLQKYTECISVTIPEGDSVRRYFVYKVIV